MKLLLKLLCAATLVSLSVAAKNKRSFEMIHQNLHREPPFRGFVSHDDDDEIVETKWIEQRMDNFDPQDKRTFQMRYMENNFHLQDGGPIFIYVGGEWTITPGWLRGGHMYDMARQLNGIVFYTEHRYYGESRMTPDLTTENLKWLNVDQALADLAHFIIHIKETIPEVRNSGVILVGASYSATMVTWFMQKYPHLVNGVWASSAPLLAKVDFFEYKEVVAYAFEEVGGPECTGRITRAFEELEQLVEDGNTDRIEEVFGFCFPFDLSVEIDVWAFFDDIAGPFSGIVQSYRESSGGIQRACNRITDSSIENDLEALAAWWWYPSSPAEDCYDHRYENWIDWFNSTTWDSWAAESEWRQWLYQTCAEYGWYQSSGTNNTLFGSSFPADLMLQLCVDAYSAVFLSEDVHRNVDRSNVIYGGLNPSVRNVYSTHGQFDPWRAMGVQEDINEYSPTVILPNESHCSDLYSANEEYDSPEMTASKIRIFELVKLWLGIEEPETTTGTDEPETTIDTDEPETTTDTDEPETTTSMTELP